MRVELCIIHPGNQRVVLDLPDDVPLGMLVTPLEDLLETCREVQDDPSMIAHMVFEDGG
jgi:hypothetical protein